MLKKSTLIIISLIVISPVLLAQPRLEEFGAVWALETFS